MTRIEKINLYTEEILPDIFSSGREKIIKYCEIHSQEIVAELIDALFDIISQVEDLQHKNQKAAIKYVLFSPLHSGLVLGNNRLRIDMMSQNLYIDQLPVCTYINLDGIYQFFDEDMEYIKRKMSQIIPRLYAYEIELIQYDYALNYHRIVKKFIEELFDGLCIDDIFKKVDTEDKVTLLFGGYMDENESILVLERRSAK